MESIHCEPSERAAARAKLEQLMDEIIGVAPLSRDDVLNHLHGHFLEYRKEKRKAETLIVAQSKKPGSQP